MNKRNLNPSNVLCLAILYLTCLWLVGCSNGNSNSSTSNNNNGDISTLQLTTPMTMYSNPTTANISYIVITNPTNTIIKNLHYSLRNLVGGATSVQIESSSSENCSMITPYSQCNLKVIIPAGAVAGSLRIGLNNNQSNLPTIMTQAIGIQQSAYNNLYGADGITLNYSQTVITGKPYILISGLVASANAGNFNNVVLVDSNNTPIPNQQLIAGAGVYTQGKTFSILLSVPAANDITQVIKVQTRLITPTTSVSKKSLATTEIVSTATTSSTLSTTNNIGIIEMLPSAIYLSQSNTEQSITFSNTGNVAAQLQNLATNNPNIEINFTSAELTSEATSTATLKLKDPAQPAISGGIILTYFNGKEQTKSAAIADQNVNPAPAPTPTPKPTPTPTPAPQPIAGLTATLNPDNNFFVTTANDTTSRQLTITNTGNTNENNFVLTLPANFTISSGNSNSCTVTSGTSPATISNSLSAGTGSCDVTVTYSNSTVTTQAADSISIAYNYNNGIAATPVTVGINYKVTQSTANLSISPISHNFGSIVANNSDASANVEFTITNSGDIATDGSSFSTSITGTNSNMFGTNNTGIAAQSRCSSLLAAGSSCKINVQFGPTTTVVNPATASLNANYVPYSGQSSIAATSSLSGVSVSAASINISEPTGGSFSSGDGSNDTPYLVNTNTNATLTFTFTNTGNQAAIDFYITNTTLPTGWTRTGGTCGSATGTNLPNTGSNSCTVIYTINTATAGSNDFNQDVMTEHWTDQANPGGISQAVVSDTTFVTVQTPPAITINNLQGDATNVMGTSPITFIATISGSGTSTLTATLANSVTGTIVSDPSPCALDTSGTTSCSFTIIPWYTGFDNSTVGLSGYDPYIASGTEIALSATNDAAISGTSIINSSISYIITTPYVYLPAPQEGAASDNNTGITWGPGGTVSTRFEAGTADGGGACPSGQEVRVDNLTGLMWVQAPSSTTYTWANAQTSPAIPATYCGYTDWRLPTETELLSLVNYAAPNADLAAWLIAQGFTNIQADYYWSSTPGSDNISVWMLSMQDGTIFKQGNASTAYVWPVRSR